MANVLISGASGFIGRSLVNHLADEHTVTAMTRRADSFPESVRSTISTLDDRASLASALKGQQVVVHAAGKAHGRVEAGAYTAVNLHGTVAPLEASARQNVQRFVFLSSVAVYGKTHSDVPISESTPLQPVTAYGQSKLAAEQAIEQLAGELGIEYVTVRPPAVYGHMASGNFQRLTRLVKAGLPLPLGRATNPRSYVSITNLSDFIRLCISHPEGKNNVYHVSDDVDVSTADLIRQMSLAFGHKPRLIPVPLALLKLGATLIGQPDLYHQLCGRLQLDISKAKSNLGWHPPQTQSSALQALGPG